MADFGLNLETWWQALRQLLTPSVFSGPITEPVPVFLIIMAIMLVAPLLFERFKLPGIVGLSLFCQFPDIMNRRTER